MSAYLGYVKVIPWMKAKVSLVRVEGGYHPRWRVMRFLFPTLYWVPNRWWYRFLALQAVAFVVVFTVALRVALSIGWRNPFVLTDPINGLPSMPGWFYDLAYARSTDSPNSAHLVSYLGIPLLGLYSMWKFRDMFMGLLMGAFYVAIHESVWTAFYYLGYSQFLTMAELTNVLKDVSFASMVILFILAFWKYPDRKIQMRQFTPVVIIYTGTVVAWFFVPQFFGFGIFPITTINNYEYGHGVYSETDFWGDPTVNLLEVFSWFGLYLMFQYVLTRWKREPPRVG